MARFSSTFIALAVILSLVPVALSGPACAKKHWQAADCIQRCKSKWGFPGRMMGTNSWGVVMQKSEIHSQDAWNRALASACGLTSSDKSTSGGPVKADGSLPNIPSSTSTIVQSASAPLSSSLASVKPSSSTSTSSQTRTITLNRAAVKGGLATQAPTSSSSSIPVLTSSSAAPPPPPSPLPPPPPPPPRPTTSRAPSEKSSPSPPPAQKPAPPQPAPPSTGDSSSVSGGDIGAYLSAHNSVRAQHGAAALSWSDNLANKAQQWANNCQFQHSKGSLGPFGENLAAGTGDTYNIQSAIKSWTDEVKDYNPNNPVPSHFTQVVWKGSNQVGCAMTLCDGIFDPRFGKAKYFVCEYSPQGNIVGEFAQNVQA